jgi:hypothetical protein
MRFTSIFLMLLACSLCVAAATDVVRDYQAFIGRITDRAIEDALYKQPSGWNKLSMKLRFNVTDDGHIRDVKITSDIRNRWAEDTARRALFATRLPAVPKEVLARVGHNGLYSSAELRMGR